LDSLGFSGVQSVRVGKQIVIELKATDGESAMRELEEMSEALLANTVIEDYNIEIEE
jgi:phosphoribosylformylglycinamidine synthase